MRKHGGTQLALPALCIAVVAGLLILTACSEGGNDAVQRRRAERFGAIPTAEQVATSAPTVEPTTIAAQAIAGDVRTAVSADPDGDAFTQFASAAALVIFGIPMFWDISLRKSGGRR